MTKIKKYKYIGRNGTLTTSILLDGAMKIDMFCLIADPGKVLTNGESQFQSIFVYADDLENWYEVDISEGQE